MELTMSTRKTRDCEIELDDGSLVSSCAPKTARSSSISLCQISTGTSRDAIRSMWCSVSIPTPTVWENGTGLATCPSRSPTLSLRLDFGDRRQTFGRAWHKVLTGAFKLDCLPDARRVRVQPLQFQHLPGQGIDSGAEAVPRRLQIDLRR